MTDTQIILIIVGGVLFLVVLAWILWGSVGLVRRGVAGVRRKAAKTSGRSMPSSKATLEQSIRAVVEQGLGAVAKGSIDALAGWAASKRPNLEAAAAPDGTVTLLFSDIENSTALLAEMGDRRWLKVIEAHHTLVRKQIAANAGHEVKSQGDGFMVAFSSARRAVDCAIGIQRALAGGRTTRGLRVRIGMHTGEVMRHDGDLYGRNVVMAARVADLADGGQILVSSIVKELTDSAGDLTFDQGRDVEVRGLDGPRRVYAVAWEGRGR